jgi:hypothetical protein
METKKKNNKNYIYSLFGISIILIFISITLNISQYIVTDESIVLLFIGILATFIVVSNYSQVSDIKSNIDNKIEKLEEQQVEVLTLKKQMIQIENSLTQFLFVQLQYYFEEGMKVEAFDYFFDNYSKQLERRTLEILWKYYGGMYIGEKKTQVEEENDKSEYQRLLSKSTNLDVDNEILKYMEKAFLLNGEVKISYLS